MNHIIAPDSLQTLSLLQQSVQPDLSLYQRIIAPANLMAAWKRVRRNKGC